MGERGEWKSGSCQRQIGANETRLIGFSTYAGTVTATSNWNETAQLKRVRPALEIVTNCFFTRVGIPNFFLNLRDEKQRRFIQTADDTRHRRITDRKPSGLVITSSPSSAQFDGVIILTKPSRRALTRSSWTTKTRRKLFRGI